MKDVTGSSCVQNQTLKTLHSIKDNILFLPEQLLEDRHSPQLHAELVY